MSFTRSASGIKNYSKFYGKYFMFYIEGKKASASKTRDELFYEKLLETVLGHQSFKIKTVGNKIDVLDYWEKIRQQNSSNSVAIIDRDLDGINCSIIESKNLIYTLGYSWENDFWGEEIVKKIVSELTIADLNAQSEAQNRLHLMAKRLSKISALDIGAQFNSTSLITKNKSSCGIGFNEREPSLIPKKEYRRVLNKLVHKKLTDCQQTRKIIGYAISSPNHRSIQGHLWENACINLICTVYKKYAGAKSAPHGIITNLAMSKINSKPEKYISTEVLDHFKKSISSAI